MCVVDTHFIMSFSLVAMTREFAEDLSPHWFLSWLHRVLSLLHLSIVSCLSPAYLRLVVCLPHCEHSVLSWRFTLLVVCLKEQLNPDAQTLCSIICQLAEDLFVSVFCGMSQTLCMCSARCEHRGFIMTCFTLLWLVVWYVSVISIVFYLFFVSALCRASHLHISDSLYACLVVSIVYDMCMPRHVSRYQYWEGEQCVLSRSRLGILWCVSDSVYVCVCLVVCSPRVCMTRCMICVRRCLASITCVHRRCQYWESSACCSDSCSMTCHLAEDLFISALSFVSTVLFFYHDLLRCMICQSVEDVLALCHVSVCSSRFCDSLSLGSVSITCVPQTLSMPDIMYSR